MNSIQVFQNVQFGQIQVIIIKNEPWFIGKEICSILGYARPENAVIDRVDKEDRMYVDSKTHPEIKDEFDYKALGQRGGWLINESGLYAAIFGSALETAKKFKHWVTGEVLPSIRKTGSYGQPQTTDGKIALLAQGHTELRAEVDGIKTEIKALKDDMPVFQADAKDIQSGLRKKAVESLGGYRSSAYMDNSIRGYVFADIQRELKRQFGVKRYDQIRHKDAGTALEVIAGYELPFALKGKVDMANAQQSLELKGGAGA